MSFLAPVMLWGAVAAGIPIALHFFFRSRYRRVPWAAMKFLLTSIEQTSRRLKFQELLLLLARVALLVLLALALARPTSSARPGAAPDAVDAVFVIDTSYSMDARDGPATRLDHAREAAKAVLDHLPPHSTVQIITCADRATLAGPHALSDLDQARQVIERVELSHLATDFLPGVSAAFAALQRGHSPNKEFYLFSDMQKLGWEQQAAALNQKLQDIGRQATVYLVRCGSRWPRNVGLVGLVPQSGIPHTGERAGFAVLARNSGLEKARNLLVSLTVDNQPSERETLPIDELGPGETKAVTLTARLDHPGLRILTASIKNDELEADNRYDQVIQVRDQVRILVVDGAPNTQEPEKAASFYLLHALLPVEESDKATYAIQPRLVRPQQAEPASLSDKDLCILVNVALTPGEDNHREALAREFVDQLATFVRTGHGLIIFGGDRVALEPYIKILYQQHGLLPLKLSASKAQEPVHLDRNSAKGQFFSLFRSDEYYKGLNGIEVRRYLDLHMPAKAAGTGQMILRYSNGRPAIVTRKVEAGEVMLVTTSADLSWSDWPLWKGMYVPFVDMAVNYMLHRQTRQYNQIAGELLHWYPPEKDAGQVFALIRPDGNRLRLGPPEIIQGRPVVTAGPTDRAGIYHIALADRPSSEIRNASYSPAEPNAGAGQGSAGVPFAVVPDPRECDSLETLTDQQIDERLGFKAIHLQAGKDLSVFSGTERLNREWTLWLLGAALGMALVETGLAWLCGRAW